MQVSAARVVAFRATVTEYYADAGRAGLPWRQPDEQGRFEPYAIMVSELMLQQTQVGRVIPKYQQFLARFPDVSSLAAAPLADVLVLWQGLGYNRRARFLWQAAGQVAAEAGTFPDDLPGLVALPGVGRNTAGAIMAYAYDAPVSFVETNIRTVFIHHFYKDATAVSDAQLLPLVTASLPPDSAPPGSNRQWYWALMDYGSHLKRTVGNLSRLSAGYTRQSAFEGSRRQVRGAVLRALAAGPLSLAELAAAVPDARLDGVLDDLGREQLIRRRADQLALAER